MRKLILFVGALLVSLSVFSQDISSDVIILKNGSEIVAKILEVTQSEIRYKDWSNLDGPIYTINKSDVFLLKYKNGKKDIVTSSEIVGSKKSETMRISSFNLGRCGIQNSSESGYSGFCVGVSNQWGIKYNKTFICSGVELYNYVTSVNNLGLYYGSYLSGIKYTTHAINLGMPISVSYTDFGRSNFYCMGTISPSVMVFTSTSTSYNSRVADKQDEFFPGNFSTRLSLSMGYSAKMSKNLVQIGPYIDNIVTKGNFFTYGVRLSMVRI
jgi:hypothetical protein